MRKRMIISFEESVLNTICTQPICVKIYDRYINVWIWMNYPRS